MKTYIYLGHGQELYNDKRHVYHDSTLSTITETGLFAKTLSAVNLSELCQTHKELVKHPRENKDALDLLFTGSERDGILKQILMEGKYHLKTEGRPYYNKTCSFLFDFEYDDVCCLSRSGLYEIDTPGLNLPTLKNEDDMIDESAIDIYKSEGLTITQIKALYRGCVYPRITDILDYIRLHRPKTIRQKLKFTVNKNTFFSKDRPYSRTVPRNKDLQFRVKTQLAKLIPYDLFIDAVASATTKTVADLMRDYPGNHYYFVCRNYDSQYARPYENVKLNRQISGEKNAPKNLNYSTLLGKDNFKFIIQQIYIKNDPEYTDHNYEDMIFRLKGYFNTLNDVIEDGGQLDERHDKIIGFVDTTVRMIDENIKSKQIHVDDVDSELMDLITKATRYL